MTNHICGRFCENPDCIRRQRDEMRDQIEEATRPAADASLPLSEVAIAALYDKRESLVEFARKIEQAHGIYFRDRSPYFRDALCFNMT